jgi:hypothetical protein
MRPIQVSLGPFAASSTTALRTASSAVAGQLVLNGTLASVNFTGTATISGAVLTVSAVTSGSLSPGQTITGAGISAGTVILSQGTGTTGIGTYYINNSQTFASGTIYSSQVATLDNPRRIQILSTATETGAVFTVVGTDWFGQPATETISGVTTSAVSSKYSYKTVTSVSISIASVGNISIGTTGYADSAPIAMDPWAFSSILCQIDPIGSTITTNIQVSGDDPNNAALGITGYAAPTYQNMNWVNTSVTALVGATTQVAAEITGIPVFIRAQVTNAGSNTTSTVHVTFTQAGNVPY